MSKKRAGSLCAELHDLSENIGLEIIDTVIVSIKGPSSKYLIGNGKAQEIADLLSLKDADCLIFDDDLSPTQQRNWENLTSKCVIDRREVIYEIFSDRAKTREAALQSALAQMEYSLPRLTRAWTHLSRQRGGAKGTKGKGETQLESDRRSALIRINKIKNELKKIEKERHMQRKRRTSFPKPFASIVGYTNAGKSSLLNYLTGSGVLVENKLFATLDTTTKKLKLPGGMEILISDTVGFIRNLPHDLVEAFKSTLEEVVLADFILLVIDASNEEYQEHIKATKGILNDLGANEKPCLLIFNKIDLVENLEPLKNEFKDACFISVKQGIGTERLLEKIKNIVSIEKKQVTVKLPAECGDLKALLHRISLIENEIIIDNEIFIRTSISDRYYNRFAEYIISEK